MLVVPLQPVPNQTMQVLLANQATTINVYQTAYGLFMDVLVGTQPIAQGVICLNLNRIIRADYLGYVGDFCFIDVEGTDDPVYTGLGSRWSLLYLEASDLAAAEAA